MRWPSKTICSPARSAFTLVELLVAMGIFVILASLTVGGFRSAYDSDRVGEAASTLRAGIEGARSRAIKSKEKRGLRLLLDPQDNRMVTSIVYVGEPEVVEGYLRVEYDNRESPEPGPAGQLWRVFAVPDPDAPMESYQLWKPLFERGLLRLSSPQCTVEFAGKRYQLVRRSTQGSLPDDYAWIIDSGFVNSTPAPDESPEYVDDDDDLGGYRPNNADPQETSGSGSPIGLPRAVVSMPMKYKLHLLPAVLEGTNPVALPRNTCIDLDGSKIPEAWRPGSTGRNYGPIAGSEVLPMDILFTPRGQLDRTLVAEGFLHFRLADRNDVMAARTTSPASAFLPNTGASPIVVKNPEHPGKLVSLVTRTGVLRISNVFGEGSTSSPPDYNNQLFDLTAGERPFDYAIYGREAKR